MQEFWNRMMASADLQSFMPTLLSALAVLVVGWLVALVAAALVRATLRRTTIDNKIVAWIFAEAPVKDLDVERKAGRVVFWLLMIFVLVAFFQVLGLTMVSDPLRVFLERFVAFLPQLLGAAALLVLAWLVATGLRFTVRRALTALKIDERVGAKMEDEEEPARTQVKLSVTVAETVYWLTFLLFLPMVLDALALDGLLEPVTGMIEQVLQVLPRLLAAALVLVVGWFVARVLRRVVTRFLAAAGFDRFGKRIGVDLVLGRRSLSELVGTVVYALVLVPVFITALERLALQAITGPATQMLERIFAALPLLFAAALILAIAYAVGRMLDTVVASVLSAVGFDRLFVGLGFVRGEGPPPEGEERRTPSRIAGLGVLVAVMLFAAIEALEMLEFGTLALLVADVTVFLGKVLLGLAVFTLGLYLGRLASGAIRDSDLHQAALVATAARVAIVVLASAMALRQVGIGDDIIFVAFSLVLGAAAVAFAIAFGVGGRDLAARQLDRWHRQLGEPDAGAEGGNPAP